ncbi:MAG: BON domain-containing protein [Thermoanaerobaculia bacterium]
MTRKQSLTISAIAVTGITASAVWMVVQHSGTGQTSSRTIARAEMMAPAPSPAPDPSSVETAIQKENLPIAGLTVRSVGPIVILRGNGNAESAAKAEFVAKSMGCTRVANLIKAEKGTNDENIRREAERQLANTRALDGCTLRVSCQNGILRVSGNVQSELQKDTARMVLKGVGAKEVRIDLSGV